MAWAGRNVLAVVPARGGSKGIPRKNLSLVGGKSLLQRAAAVAQALPWIDATILSTDDAEIAEHGRAAGLEVPFMRPAALATDEALSVDVWRHAWLECERLHGRRYELSLLLEPSSPLREPADLERSVQALLAGDHAAAATVSPTPGHFVPHKALTVDPQGVLGFVMPDGTHVRRRQDAPRSFHVNGLCYAALRATVVERGTIIQDRCAAVIVERPVVNIDDPFDLELAEFLLARRPA